MTAGNRDDPISAASAGLRALGVSAPRRLETLVLLSALLDISDPQGEVVLDTTLIATEERLGIDSCLEGYEWLERLDIIRRTWAGWTIPAFAQHHGPAGMNAAAMAVLARHLPAPADPALVAARDAPAADDVIPVLRLRPWRRRAPAVAASIAAGIAALAGATQLVPQVAVRGRNAAVRTQGSTIVSQVTSSSVVTPAEGDTTEATSAASATASGHVEPTTTTTSLPGVPCVSESVNDLASRTGLGLHRNSADPALPPGVLPCP